MNKPKNRTSTEIEVKLNINGKEQEEFVYVPFPIFIDAIRKMFDSSLITLDGKDNDIWNIFVDLGAIDNFSDNDEFINICKEMYSGSKYEEEDIEYLNWLNSEDE